MDTETLDVYAIHPFSSSILLLLFVFFIVFLIFILMILNNNFLH